MGDDSHPIRPPRRAALWGAGAVLVATAVTVLAVRTLGGTERGTPGDGAAAGVEIIETSGPKVRGSVVSSGRDLIAVTEQGGALRLARSGDSGRSWEAIDLPGAPSLSPFEPIHLRTVAGLVVATVAADSASGDHTYDGYVWVTEDGDEWSGGLVVESTPDVSFGNIGELDGGLVTATTSPSGELVVLTSRDQGRSWARTNVQGMQAAPDEALTPQAVWRAETGGHRMVLQSHGVAVGAGDEPRDPLIESVDGGSTWRLVDFCPAPLQRDQGPCDPVTQVGRLWLRGLEASVDGGASWAPAGLDLPQAVAASFDAAAELPGGGWLATVRGQVLGGGGALAWVLRSDDGVAWTPLLGPGTDGCPGSSVDTDEPPFAASPPVAAADGTHYVSFTCPASTDGRSVLASFGPGDRSVDIVHEAEAGRLVLGPVRSGDRLLAPVLDGDDRLVQVIQVPPE